MKARYLIAAFLLVFSSIVSTSFAYGLLLLWRGPSRPAGGVPERPARLPPDVAALLERSAEQMKKGEVEQAVLGYRRVLTLGPSLEALLGLAEGESRAGREDVAIREYERVLRLEPQNTTAPTPRPRLCGPAGEVARGRSPLSRIPDPGPGRRGGLARVRPCLVLARERRCRG